MNIDEFPKEYMKKGKFTLHSGRVSDVFYDVNAFITDTIYKHNTLRKIPKADSYVGIATCGAIIASHCLNFAMIKDKELKGEIKGDYCLIDDVVTTEKSIKEAIEIIGHKPKCIFVVVDRRDKKERTLNIRSMYVAED